MIRVKNPQDFWSGALFIAFGAIALWVGRNYNMGSIVRMGPGYLPRFLSAALVAIGLFLAVRGVAINGPSIQPSLYRPQIFILLAIVVFGLMIERFGLAPAVLVTTVFAALASDEIQWKETTVLAVGMSITSVVLFIYLLGQTMEKWTWGF